jgi:hypothetical protein
MLPCVDKLRFGMLMVKLPGQSRRAVNEAWLIARRAATLASPLQNGSCTGVPRLKIFPANNSGGQAHTRVEIRCAVQGCKSATSVCSGLLKRCCYCRLHSCVTTVNSAS